MNRQTILREAKAELERHVWVPTMGALLGHTTIQMTMRYVHPAAEQKPMAIARK